MAIAAQKVMDGRGVGTCLQVGARSKVGGGQSTGIFSKKLYFEAILVKFKQKWGAVAPPAPWFQQPRFGCILYEIIMKKKRE